MISTTVGSTVANHRGGRSVSRGECISTTTLATNRLRDSVRFVEYSLRCRLTFTFGLAFFLLSANAYSQGQDAVEPSRSTYDLVLTEFRLNSGPNPALTSQDIIQSVLKAKEGSDVELVETVRMTAITENECMVQFGRQSTVTSGYVQAGDRRTRTTQSRQVGTLVRVMLTPKNGKVMLQLTYESSRFDGAGDDEGLVDIVTNTFNSLLLIEPGKPHLVGGQATDKSKYLMISVR